MCDREHAVKVTNRFQLFADPTKQTVEVNKVEENNGKKESPGLLVPL